MERASGDGSGVRAGESVKIGKQRVLLEAEEAGPVKA
jgi:hypothetical protein